jgi:hypothetical protein
MCPLCFTAAALYAAGASSAGGVGAFVLKRFVDRKKVGAADSTAEHGPEQKSGRQDDDESLRRPLNADAI